LYDLACHDTVAYAKEENLVAVIPLQVKNGVSVLQHMVLGRFSND
jgi:hypothetical protein